MRVFAFASAIAVVSGHGAMNRPAPRSSLGANFTDRPGCAGPGKDGQACLWYNIGCQNGCECAGEGKAMYPKPADLQCTNPMEPTLPDKFRTWNIGAKSEQGDWGKYMPWRAPGHSVAMNPCGIASGFKDPNNFRGGVPIGHKPGDNGTDLPPLSSPPVVWKAGGVQMVSFALLVNHGGGYQYRLCPKSKQPTNECFEQMPLAFATNTHTIHTEDGSQPDVHIPAHDVSTGTKPAGSTWRRDPIPACNCDLSEMCSNTPYHSYERAYVDNSTYYHGTRCPTGVQFEPPAPGLFGYTTMIGDPQGRPQGGYSIQDHVQVPAQKGEYILQWRWDCEQTPQIWGSCADVSVQ